MISIGWVSLYRSVHHCAERYITVQKCTSLHKGTSLYRSVHHCTEVYIIVQKCTSLYRSVHHCTEVYITTVVYVTVQKCTSLYRSVHDCTEVYNTTEVWVTVQRYTSLYRSVHIKDDSSNKFFPYIRVCLIIDTSRNIIQKLFVRMELFRANKDCHSCWNQEITNNLHVFLV
jgi:uncharacterized protein YgiB involved in biofilm formation